MAEIVLHQSSQFEFLDVSSGNVHRQVELAIMAYVGVRELL